MKEVKKMIDITLDEKEKVFLNNLEKDENRALRKLSSSDMTTIMKVFCNHPSTGDGLFDAIRYAFVLGYRRGGNR